MNLRIVSKYLYVLLFSLLLLLSCCEKSSSNSTKKQLHISFQTQPVTIDPRQSGDPFSSSLIFMIFDGLTHLESDGSISMALAKSVDISEDLKTYTFHLRDSKWSDGIEITAKDFEKTWKKILDPHFPSMSSHLFYPIKNAEKAKKGLISPEEVGVFAKDKKTLVVELENNTPYFLELVSFSNFFPTPTHITTDLIRFDSMKKFVCNGPFQIEKWECDRKIELKKNPFFWDKEHTPLDKLFIHIISDEMTALQMYEKDELDLLGGFVSPIPLEALPTLQKKQLLRKKPIAGTMISAFNTKMYPFNNKNIRKAFSYSINRKEIIQNITQNNELVATGAIPPVLKKNNKRVFFEDGNVSEAKKYFFEGLKELNISKEHFPIITLSYYAGELQHRLAQVIQAQWKKTLDIDVKLEKIDFKIFLDKIFRRDYQAANLSWIAQYYDQMSILERFKYSAEPKNYFAWENEKYIQIIDAAMRIPKSQKYYDTLEEAESLLIDEMPFAPIFHFNSIYMQKPHVQCIDITPIETYRFKNTDIVY